MRGKIGARHGYDLFNESHDARRTDGSFTQSNKRLLKEKEEHKTCPYTSKLDQKNMYTIIRLISLSGLYLSRLGK